jgi:hypothetical protein
MCCCEQGGQVAASVLTHPRLVFLAVPFVARRTGEPGAAAVAEAAQQLAAGKGPAAELRAALLEGLLDDLNTPACVAALVGPAGPLKAANDLLTTKAGRKNPKR